MKILVKFFLALSFCLTNNNLFAAHHGDHKGTKGTRSITLVNYETKGVKQWMPGFFVAKEGEVVELTLINKAKGIHGFRISSLKIDETLKKNEKKKIIIKTQGKAGIHQVDCQLHGAHVGGQFMIVKK